MNSTQQANTEKIYALVCKPGHHGGNRLPVYSRHATRAEAYSAFKKGGKGCAVIELYNEEAEYIWEHTFSQYLCLHA